MKRKVFIISILCCLALGSCATMRQPVNVLMMSPAERINYYEMQIKNYQELIKQEKLKIDKK